MERYVFETAHHMISRGHEVTILCRSTDMDAAKQISAKVIVLRPGVGKRGWQDRVFFARAVTDYFRDNPGLRKSFDIVHAHENTTVQDVSTEHGPCTLAGLRNAPWKFVDYSALRNLAVERAKFSAPRLRALVSCSDRVQGTLLRVYPQLQSKMRVVIPPAYAHLKAVNSRRGDRPPTVGFIGFDWKRKGLPKALEVFRCLKEEDPRWRMRVAGCNPEILPSRLIHRAGAGVEFLGPSEPQKFFASIDVLLHPAHEEPFGMVVAEALSCGVPAVISDRCGCNGHLQSDGLRILAVEAPPAAWTPACRQLAVADIHLPIGPRGWADVAAEHEVLYRTMLDARS